MSVQQRRSRRRLKDLYDTVRDNTPEVTQTTPVNEGVLVLPPG